MLLTYTLMKCGQQTKRYFILELSSIDCEGWEKGVSLPYNGFARSKNIYLLVKTDRV